MVCACSSGGGSCCKSSSSTNPSGVVSNAVPLPKHGKNNGMKPVWEVNNNAEDVPSTRAETLDQLLLPTDPLNTKCSVHEREGQCCKDLKGEDERYLISPEVVRDVIVGLSDGLTVPFALTAGLSGLGSSRLVVTGGLAELCAGAISMGLGGYLASQAEMDHYHYLRRQTHARVARSCSGEMEREVHSILGPIGVKEGLSRLVANDLRTVEEEALENASRAGSASSGKSWWKIWKREGGIRLEEEGGSPGGDAGEMGLTAFLLKFGEGMEEVPPSRLYISALTIGLSYFIGGLIPLVPYMAAASAEQGLIISCIVTGVVLFIFGAFKTYFTGATGGYGGYLYGATSTLFVGGIAAAAAFGLVKVLDPNAA